MQNQFVPNYENDFRMLLIDYFEANHIPNTISINEGIKEGIVIVGLTILLVMYKKYIKRYIMDVYILYLRSKLYIF